MSGAGHGMFAELGRTLRLLRESAGLFLMASRLVRSPHVPHHLSRS